MAPLSTSAHPVLSEYLPVWDAGESVAVSSFDEQKSDLQDSFSRLIKVSLGPAVLPNWSVDTSRAKALMG